MHCCRRRRRCHKRSLEATAIVIVYELVCASIYSRERESGSERVPRYSSSYLVGQGRMAWAIFRSIPINLLEYSPIESHGPDSAGGLERRTMMSLRELTHSQRVNGAPPTRDFTAVSPHQPTTASRREPTMVHRERVEPRASEREERGTDGQTDQAIRTNASLGTCTCLVAYGPVPVTTLPVRARSLC